MSISIYSLERSESIRFTQIASTMNLRRLLGFLGCAALIAGVFCPILNVSAHGNYNYLETGDGTLILVLSALSFFLVLFNKYEGLYIITLVIAGIFVYTYINIHSQLLEAKSGTGEDLSENMFAGITDLSLDSVNYQWGWILLIAGLAVLTTSAYMRQDPALAERAR